MTEFLAVPTTEQVRNNHALGVALATISVDDPELLAGVRDVNWPVPGLRDAYKAQFDVWLEQVKQDAWDAGAKYAIGLARSEFYGD